MKAKKIFYGWYMVAACFIMLFFGVGIGYNCLALFIKPISEGLGFSRASVAMVQTVIFATTFALSFVAGKIYGHFGTKNVIRFGSLVMPLSWVMFSFSRSLPMLYLSGILMAVGFYTASMMACSIILSNWFKDKIGTVTGIAFMGSGFGGMIFNTVSGILLSNYSWHTCMLILACVMFASLVPLAFFVIKVSPQEMGLLPYGADTQNAVATEGQTLPGLTLKQAMKTYQFWLFALAFALYNIPGNIASQTMSAHLTDVGYSISFAANISAAYMGLLAVGKIILGALMDKKGLKTGCIVVCILLCITYTGMYFAGNVILLLLAIASMGTANSFGSIGNPTVTRSVFGSRDYAAIYGIIGAFSSIGGLFAPIISNGLFEIFGSYNIAYLLCFGLAVLLFLVFMLANAKKPSFEE